MDGMSLMKWMEMQKKKDMDLSTGPTPLVNKKLGERVMADTSPDMMIPSNPSPKMALSEVGESMGNVEELGKSSAKLAGYDSVASAPTESSTFEAAGAGSANPGLGVAKIALGVMKAQAAMDEKERQEAFQAQAKTHSNMSSALANLARIGTTLNLG